MTFEITLDLIAILQSVILLAISGGVGWLSRRNRETRDATREVRDELRKLNGRLARMEEWRGEHEKANAFSYAALRDLFVKSSSDCQ